MATVLLVDDDSGNREALQQALESRGHSVVTAENGRDALLKAGWHVPALVITDLEMPEMDGEELSRRLESRSAVSHLPVVLLSALPEPPSPPHWKVFFRKPAPIEALLRVVDMLIAARVTGAGVAPPHGLHTRARRPAIDPRCWP